MINSGGMKMEWKSVFLLACGTFGARTERPGIGCFKVPRGIGSIFSTGRIWTDGFENLRNPGRQILSTPGMSRMASLWVDYKNYTGQFNNRFGHMAYQKRKFSY